MSRGTLLILTGASSVGKNKIRDALLKDKDFHLFYSISMTTRKQKENEIDGKDYYFVSQKAFAQAIQKHSLLEFAEFDGHYYGTPKAHVEFLLENGKDVLVEVEAQGVGQIKLHYPDAVAFFIKPNSMEELKKQILLRYNGDASASRRISKASVEMEMAAQFKHVLTNDNIEESIQKIKEIYNTNKNK